MEEKFDAIVPFSFKENIRFIPIILDRLSNKTQSHSSCLKSSIKSHTGKFILSEYFWLYMMLILLNIAL